MTGRGPAESLRRDSSARAVGFSEALRYWVRLGFVSFGGPAGQIAIMQRDLVDRRRWISQERFLHALSYCMLLPGPEAQQLAIYIGWLLHGTWGGVVAGAFFVLPSIFILWGLSAVYAAYGTLPVVAGIFAGLKPAVVALVVAALIRIGARALRPRGLVAIAAAAFGAIFVLHVPFPWIVIGAGVIGFLAGRIWPRDFSAARPIPGLEESDPAAQQSRARTEEARRSWPRALRIGAAGLFLWSAPFLALGLWRGWSSLHVLQYRFFTQAAFVTFGGAYAVLAYVLQAAVQSYHWITQHQAIDGLGLAETTPGPLIMVLQFVGFMTGWNRPEGMSRLASASLGAGRDDLGDLPPLLLLHLPGSSLRRGPAGKEEPDGGALGNHRGGRRGHPEPGGRLRIGGPLPVGIGRPSRRLRAGRGAGRLRGPLLREGRRDLGCPGRKRGRPGTRSAPLAGALVSIECARDGVTT